MGDPFVYCNTATYTPSFWGINTSACDANYSITERKIETKKERRDRISKEKMHASWQLFNQKSQNVKEVIQICKPRHRLPYLTRHYA